MCSKCSKIFCKGCQETYYKLPANVICMHCRQVATDKFKPLNKQARKQLKKLKFKCPGCPVILGVNNKGIGTGHHAETCTFEVTFKCSCNQFFSGSYSAVRFTLKEHLNSECPKILCPTTRNLRQVVNRFAEWGVPQQLIEFYKTSEQFNFID